MRSIFVAALAAMAVMAAGTAYAQADLAKKDGCLNCHAVDTKKVGPAYKDVAAKYKGKAGADATLVAKITAGKEHPAVKASPEDVQQLVKWVLSM